MAEPVKIEDVRGLGNYSSLSKWTVDIVAAPGASYSTLSALKINIRATTAKVPLKIVVADLEVKIRGFGVSQAGEDEWDHEWNCVGVETEDNAIKNFIAECRKLKHDSKTGEMETKAKTEFVVTLTQLNSKLQPIYEYKMIGARYNDATPNDYAETAAHDPIALNFKYDYCEEKAL